MNMIVGPHQAINNNFWQYLEIIFQQYLAIFVRFTLKKLRYELSSTFDITSDSEKKDILFLQITVIFEMKKMNETKGNIGYQNFFTNKKKKDHSTS